MRTPGGRWRALLLPCVLAAVLLAGLVRPAPAAAASAPVLKASRACVFAGKPVRLNLAIPLSYFPPSSPVWGSRPFRVLAGPSESPAVELVAYRLSAGQWREMSTTRLSHGDAATVSALVRPRRGRYRYVARVRSWKGVTASNAVELAVVGKDCVALTFDDGPWPSSTSGVLATLKQKDARATFFMCGYTLAAYPQLGKSVVSAGQEVGNHSYTHADLTRLSDAGVVRELASTQSLIAKTLGVTPRWCRPPYGATSTRVGGIIEGQGMKQVTWDVDPEDWKRPGASVIANRVVRDVRPGYVVLMHDGGGDRSGTVAALPVIIDRLRAKGYDFVTMSELATLEAAR